MDVRSAMCRAARYHSRREAVVHGELRLGFAEAWARGMRMANALLGLGLKRVDRVASLEDNSVEADDLFLGAAGANHRYRNVANQRAVAERRESVYGHDR